MSASKKRSPLTILISLFISLLCLIFLAVAALPTLASSSFGKEKITALINRSIPGKIHIEDISLSWLGSQSIKGISLADPDNSPVLSLESVKIDASLFKLLTDTLNSGEFEFNHLNTNIIGDAHGNTNLMRALDKQCCKIDQDSGASMAISLNNTQGRINFSSRKGPILLQLSGETEQNTTKGKFAINAELQRDSLVTSGDFSRLLEYLKIDADIVNFPVKLLDQILSLRYPDSAGLLTEVFGNALNIKIDQNKISNGVGFDVKASTPTLDAHAEILLSNELTLTSPATINLNVSPKALEKILIATKSSLPWRLSDPITANIQIANLKVPGSALKSGHIDINFVELKGSLDLTQATFQGESSAQTLSLKGLHATIDTEAHSQTANVSLNAEAIQNNQPAKVNLNIKLPKAVLLGDFSGLSFKEVTLNGDLSGIPLFALDHLTPLPVSSVLGPLADMTISLQNKDNKLLADVQVKSEYLEIPRLTFWIDRHLTLEKPAQIILKLNQTFANSLLNGSQLQGPATAQLTLNSLSLPVADLFNFASMIHQSGLDAQLKVTSLRLLNVPQIGGLSITDLNARFLANSKIQPEITTSFSLQPEASSVLAGFVGKKAAFKTVTAIDVGSNGKISTPIFNIEMVSDLARMELVGEMQSDGLVLNAPSMLSYQITPAGLQSMGIAADDYIFQHGSPFEMSIDSSRIPTSFENLSHLRLVGKLKINDFHLIQNSKPNAHAIVDNLTADWSIDGEQKLISIAFDGVTRLGENQAAGKITGYADVTKWLQNGALSLEDAKIKLNATASKLPTELINVLSGQKNLVPILGNAIDLSIDVDTSLAQTEKGTMAININSDNLSGGLALQLGDTIQLNHNRPAQFTLKLTPQGYASLRRNINKTAAGDFVLAEPTTATFKLHSIRIPRSQYLQSSLEADFFLERLIGMDTQSKKTIALNSIQGHVASSNLAEHISFNMNAKGNTNQEASSWDISGALINGFSQDGTLNKESSSLSLDGTITSLPIPLLCQFACLDEKLRKKIEIVLGPTIDAKIKAQLQRMNGPIYVEVNGQNGKLTMDAMINQGILTLNQDLKAELTVTPQLGEYVLKDMIPVLAGLLSADHPIYLGISKEGFAIPIVNPSSTNVFIGSAVLNLGKVHFSGESQIAKVLDLLTPTTTTQLVWLTPAYFSLNQGILKLERVDMLISDRYPLAAWGDADIGKDKVNMVIGLAGSAISKAFNVPKISNSYFLQLPLRGRLSSPSIDKTRAVAKISALVAQSQGGTEGLVLGTVLDIASGGFAENSVPSPTTDPLPWADMLKDAQSSETNTKEDKKNGIPNPINEIEKGASSLLKKIFR